MPTKKTTTAAKSTAKKPAAKKAAAKTVAAQAKAASDTTTTTTEKVKTVKADTPVKETAKKAPAKKAAAKKAPAKKAAADQEKAPETKQAVQVRPEASVTVAAPRTIVKKEEKPAEKPVEKAEDVKITEEQVAKALETPAADTAAVLDQEAPVAFEKEGTLPEAAEPVKAEEPAKKAPAKKAAAKKAEKPAEEAKPAKKAAAKKAAPAKKAEAAAKVKPAAEVKPVKEEKAAEEVKPAEEAKPTKKAPAKKAAAKKAAPAEKKEAKAEVKKAEPVKEDVKAEVKAEAKPASEEKPVEEVKAEEVKPVEEKKPFMDLTEEKIAFYAPYDTGTLMQMAKALGLSKDEQTIKDELALAEDLADYTAKLVLENIKKDHGYVFEDDGFDETVVPVLIERLYESIPVKVMNNAALARSIEQNINYQLCDDPIKNADEYHVLFDLVKQVLMIAQKNNIHSLTEEEKLVKANLRALIEKYMELAYALLPSWQYADVKYYEGFIYAVLSQFDDLADMHNRAMMDVADLYIIHGDYGKGDADYNYVLRENQLKDQIYFRFANVYRPIDINKAKSIASSSLQYVDGRYDYYPKIMEILHS